MSGHEELAAAFMAARSRLIGVAYAILGSHAEAEDVVSDTWLRLVDADSELKRPGDRGGCDHCCVVTG